MLRYASGVKEIVGIIHEGHISIELSLGTISAAFPSDGGSISIRRTSFDRITITARIDIVSDPIGVPARGADQARAAVLTLIRGMYL